MLSPVQRRVRAAAFAVAIVVVYVIGIRFGLEAQVPNVTGYNGSVFTDVRHEVVPVGKAHTFTTLSATGPTESIQINSHVHGTYLIVTGGPAGCTARLQGSGDGATWFDLDASDVTCTSSAADFVVDKPAVYVRLNLKTLSGGTSPTVTAYYAGY